MATSLLLPVSYSKEGEEEEEDRIASQLLPTSTANCIIIDHFSAFESGLVAPFLYAAG
jgi:hypothetical protein